MMKQSLINRYGTSGVAAQGATLMTRRDCVSGQRLRVRRMFCGSVRPADLEVHVKGQQQRSWRPSAMAYPCRAPHAVRGTRVKENPSLHLKYYILLRTILLLAVVCTPHYPVRGVIVITNSSRNRCAYRVHANRNWRTCGRWQGRNMCNFIRFFFLKKNHPTSFFLSTAS